MGKGRNSIIISGIIAAFILGTLAANPVAEAANPALVAIQNTLGQIQTTLGLIQTETDKIQMVKDDVSDIKTETDKIPMIKNNQYIPFKEEVTDDVVCDKPDVHSDPSFHSIFVQSSGTDGVIIVTGAVVVMKFLEASDTVQVQDYLFDVNGISSLTIDLTGSDVGDVGMELLGQPLTSGGTSPHQMAADEGGNTPEIVFGLRCNAGTSGPNVTIEEVFISGWKPADSSITVSLS